MDSWTQPDFLSAESADDYLAGLTSFLDADPKGAALSAGGYPHVTPLALGGFVTGGAAGVSTVDTSSLLLNDASSPELTSDSASPSSSDGNAVSHGQYRQLDSYGTPSSSKGGAAQSTGTPSATRGGRSSPTRQHHADPKRKNGNGAQGAIKDHRRTSDSGAGHHSHATGNDGVTARSESPDGSMDGKGEKGGKTSERRKAQNRQAQRNFRERKEKHLKDLEERVVTLEEQTKTQDAENAALKQLLDNLRSENARLKVYETAFTFDYDKDVSNSSAMPQSTAFRPPALTAPSAVSSTSSSPIEAVAPSDRSDSFRFSSGPSASTTMSSTSSSQANSPGMFVNASSPDVKPSTSALENALASASSSGADDSLFLTSFVNPSPSPFSSFTGLPVASPEAMSSDIFKSYRDPLASLGMPSSDLSTFADLDALLAGPSSDMNSSSDGPASALSPATQDALSAFLNPSPPALGTPSQSPASASAAAPAGATPSFSTDFGLAVGSGASPAGSASASCPYGIHPDRMAEYEQYKKNPTGKFDFDLDGLCAEMKLKATCQEAARQALQQAMLEDAAASRQTYPSAQL
ncbi:hypothetical protein BMF94_5058 [Rhodotorula taiwanensis]|uniref:BZIP domain-containing protein n=1 Tax=Rhodotorula taiwanensis TaxID=741276 RepID=A0A2S5B562_9BASI|nr:hypothetical protein BMF94_5058 [Rhodotorula taiwanensis]